MALALLTEEGLNNAFTAHGMAAVLQRVAHSVGAEGATMTYSHRSTQFGAIFSRSLLEFVPYYLKHDRPLDPRPARVNPALSEGFRVDQDDFTDDELDRSPYYRDFLRPLGFAGHACALLEGSPAGEAVNLTLRRTVDQGWFDQEELRLLSAQLPLIRATSRVTRSVAGLLGADADGRSDARRSLYGFDARGAAFVLHEGSATNGVLAVRSGRLMASGAGLQPRVSATIERAEALGRQTATILTDEDGGWWLFSVTPAAKIDPTGALTPFLSWAALTPYERSRDASDARVRELSSVFGLSPAEARVAGLIGEAKSVQATAAELGASEGTIRNHLKSIFAKIGIGRQAELVAVLSRF